MSIGLLKRRIATLLIVALVAQPCNCFALSDLDTESSGEKENYYNEMIDEAPSDPALNDGSEDDAFLLDEDDTFDEDGNLIENIEYEEEPLSDEEEPLSDEEEPLSDEEGLIGDSNEIIAGEIKDENGIENEIKNGIENEIEEASESEIEDEETVKDEEEVTEPEDEAITEIASESETEEVEEIASESEVEEITEIASESETEDVEEIASESEIEEKNEKFVIASEGTLATPLLYTPLFSAPTPTHTHFICGCEIVSAETHCSIHGVSESVSYTPINQTNAAILFDLVGTCSYVLESDVNIDTAYPTDKDILNICLNGHNLIFDKGLDFMTLINDGKITICDCAGHNGIIGYDEIDTATTDGNTFTINDGTMAIYEIDIVASFSDLVNKISLIKVEEKGKLYIDGMVIRDNHIIKEAVEVPSPSPAPSDVILGLSPLIDVQSSDTDSYVYMHNLEIKENTIKGQPLISLGGKAKFLLEYINIHDNNFEKSSIFVNNSVLSTISNIKVNGNDGEDLDATGYETRAYSGFLSFYGNNVNTDIVDAELNGNTSIYKSLVGVYHGIINLYGEFVARDNEVRTSGGIFTVIGASGKKNLNFYGDTTITENTASSNVFLFQDFGGIYVANNADVNISNNTANDSYMMTFVDGKSVGGGFLIDGDVTFYNNEALGTSD